MFQILKNLLSCRNKLQIIFRFIPGKQRTSRLLFEDNEKNLNSDRGFLFLLTSLIYH